MGKNYRYLSGLELLTKATQKLFKPKSLDLTKSYRDALNNIAYERNKQEKRSKEI